MRSVGWAAALLCCAALLHGARALKWPEAKDRYSEVARAAEVIRPMIRGDSILAIRSADVPEDLVVYLRYCLIPVQVKQQPSGTASGKVLFITSRKKIASVVTELLAAQQAPLLLKQYGEATTAFYLFQF